MFRRSFQILLVAALLALAAIVGYAALRLSGAPENLAEAETLVQRREYARAIALLDLCSRSRSVQQDAALRERLLRLRLQAHAALDNHQGALDDVAELLQQRSDDLDLQLERIRLCIAVGDGDQARRLARDFVVAHPDHGRGLELAGAACEAAYAAALEQLRTTILRDVASSQVETGRTAFATFVFGPDGDAEVTASLEVLAQLYSADARLAARWPTLARELLELRQRVQEGLGYCLLSLQRPGPHPTAASTWAKAMADAGRVDDTLMATEIQRRSDDGSGGVDAGLVAAQALLRRQADADIVATVGRWLPPQSLQARIDAGGVDDSVPDLFFTRVLAGWRLGDIAVLQRSIADLQMLQRNDIKCPVPLHTAAGLLHYLQDKERDSEPNRKNAENNFRYVSNLLQRQSSRDRWPDVLSLLQPLRLELLPKLGASETDMLGVFDAWQEARPEAPEPRVAYVRHLLERGKVPAAALVLSEVMAGQPTDEALFDLRLQLARADDSQTGQDGMSLLAQCLQRRSTTPEVTQPIGYMLCAEAAMQQRVFLVARDSARLAVDAFPQQRAPRRLVIEAVLRGGQPEAAAQQVRRLMELFPIDQATALLALRAHRAANLPLTDLLTVVLPVCSPSAELRAELLRALGTDAESALAFAEPVSTDRTAPTTLRLLASAALSRADRPHAGRQLLASVIAEVDSLAPQSRLDLIEALVAWIQGAAVHRDDASLIRDVPRMLARTDVRDPAAAPLLLRAASELEQSHPQVAYEVLLRALTIAQPTTRTGSSFALAGRLASRLRQLRLAEEHWLAALAFADGRQAAEDLARLLLAQGRSERAVQVYALAESGRDAALALRCGAVERASELAQAAVKADGADLVAQAVLAVLGQPNTTDWSAADVPANELRLDVLTLLQRAELGPEALPRARSLVAAEPASATSQLLLARACLLAGEPAEAAAIHTTLRTRSPGPLLWREVALAAAEPGYVLSEPLDADLANAVASVAIADSPVTLLFGARRMVAAFERAGYAEMALATRQNLWLQLPRAAVTTAADVGAVAAMSNPREAWYILDQALPALTGRTRSLAFTLLCEQADRILRAEGSAAADVYESALRHLATEGARGCLVHLLLDHGATLPTRQPTPKVSRSLLLAQIELAAAGRDPGVWLARSIDRLLVEQGTPETQATIEAVLQRHPTCLPLWQQRAERATGTAAKAATIRDLRQVLAHATAPEQTLAMVRLAAAAGELAAGDEALLAALPASLLGSAEGKFARGLVALRTGRPEQAVVWLADAPARADGLHLFALALAHLQCPGVQGAAQARTVLEQLAADYASSSLARHAGSFAAQLAPR